MLIPLIERDSDLVGAEEGAPQVMPGLRRTLDASRITASDLERLYLEEIGQRP